jgi:glutathione synthase/RimK-type ligase-like ATP-grasp enzyme
VEKKDKKIFAVLVANKKNYFSWGEEKPFMREILNKQYSTFVIEAQKKNIKLIFSKFGEYKNGKIKRYWTFDKKWQFCNKEIIPTMYFDKFGLSSKELKLKKLLSKKKLLINDFDFEWFCKDKFAQAKEFPKLCPKTILVSNQKDFNKAFEKFKSEKIILKPRYGHAGKGIVIYNRNKKSIRRKFNRDFVVQEFVDTSKGLPGVKIKGVHDLRCVIVNGKLIYSYVRVTKTGLLANLHHGAKPILIVPSNEVKKLIRQIDSTLKKFKKRVYSADFFFSNDKYYLVELNSKPGVDILFKKELKKFFKAILAQL